MPIKGLTDTRERPEFPCIGKLRKGSPKVHKTDKQGKPLYWGENRKQTIQKNNKPVMIQGKDLTYFRFDSQDDRAIAAFERAYGKEPTEINVLLPYETVDENFDTCKEEWGAGGLKHRCDGEFCTSIQLPNGRQQRVFAAPVPCPGGCKEIGRLQVIIPELQRFAYVTAETHSLNDIPNLYNQLTAVYKTFGHLNKLPFTLRRRPQQISTPSSDGQRSRTEKWMLSIEIDSDWASRQFQATQHALIQRASVYHAELKQGNEPLALPASVESPIEARTIEVEPIEFHQTETWQLFVSAMADAETIERVNQLEQLARQRVNEGKLTPRNAAHAAIDEEVEVARNRVSHKGYSQLPKYLEAVQNVTDPDEADTLSRSALGDLVGNDLKEFQKAMGDRLAEINQELDEALTES